METLLYWILGLQLVISTFVLLPLGQGVKNSLMNFASKQTWITHVKYLWVVIACLVFVSCTAHQKSLLDYTQLIAASDSFVPGYREHQLEAERDRNLSGVIFVLMLLLHRTTSLMSENYKARQSHAALKQQADNQARFASALLSEKGSEKKSNVAAAVGGHSIMQTEEQERIAAARREAELKVTENLMSENKRLHEEVAKLKEKLDDYVTMFDNNDANGKSKNKKD